MSKIIETFTFPFCLGISKVETMRKIMIKSFIKIGFTCSFFYFSYESFRDFLLGKTVFDNINDYNESLTFPTVTICPKVKDSYVKLNLNQMIEDLKIPDIRSLYSYEIYNFLTNNVSDTFSTIDKFSFSKNDVFPNNCSSYIS